MKQQIDAETKMMIIKLVHGLLPDDKYEKLVKWSKNNYKLFKSELCKAIDEKYKIYWKK